MRTLAILLAVLAGLWSLGWFAVAWVGERMLAGAMPPEVSINGTEVAIDCADRRIIGFPFAFRLRCASVRADGEAGAISGSLGAVHLGIGLPDPRRVSASIASPAVFEAPFLKDPIRMEWREAAASVDVSLSGLPRPSFVGSGFATAPGAGSASLERADLAADPSGDDRLLTYAGVIEGLAVRTGDGSIPPTDVTLRATLAGPEGATLVSAFEAPAGRLAVPRLDLVIVSAKSRITATGALSIDAGGFLAGTVSVTLEGADALPQALETWPETPRRLASAALGAGLAFARPGEVEGRPARVIPLTFEDGAVKIGLLKVAELGAIVPPAP